MVEGIYTGMLTLDGVYTGMLEGCLYWNVRGCLYLDAHVRGCLYLDVDVRWCL
jgi:hypothetical protein